MSAERQSHSSCTDGLSAEPDLSLRVEIGRVTFAPDDLARVSPGDVIPLDAAADDEVSLYVRDRLVAHGRLVMLDGRLCIQICEIFEQMALLSQD